MKRPVGVVLSAIVLILGSLLMLLGAGFSALMAFITFGQVRSGYVNPYAAASAQPQTSTVIVMLVFGFFLVGLAAWGITTSIGLFKTRKWALYSTLVIAGMHALFGVIGAIMYTAMMFVMSKMPLPGADPHAGRTAMAVLFGVMVFFAALTAAIGIWWLIYFNLRSVREVFGCGDRAIMPGRRPFLISLLAVCSLLGAVILTFSGLSHQPLFVLGFVMRGWQKIPYLLVFSVVNIVGGVGLWMLKKWGWWLKLAYEIYTCVLCICMAFQVSKFAQVMAQSSYSTASAAFMPKMQGIFRTVFFCSAILPLFWAAVLIYCRKAFETPVPPVDLAAVPVLTEGVLPVNLELPPN